MKFSSNFLLFVFLIFLVFACEQEDTAPTEQPLDSKARIEQYVKQLEQLLKADVTTQLIMY